MVNKKSKDAENGLQVLAILASFWTIGFIYLAWDEALASLGMSYFSITCCNVFNILLTIIFLSSWRYTKRENRIKDYIEEHFESSDSISLKYLIDEFKITNSTAYKALAIWIIETNVKGDYDPITGIFKKELVEMDTSEVIDIEFHDLPDESLSFCPNCGKKMISSDGDKWCLDCQDI